VQDLCTIHVRKVCAQLCKEDSENMLYNKYVQYSTIGIGVQAEIPGYAVQCKRNETDKWNTGNKTQI
jgi:hypothetical protein